MLADVITPRKPRGHAKPAPSCAACAALAQENEELRAAYAHLQAALELADSRRRPRRS